MDGRKGLWEPTRAGAGISAIIVLPPLICNVRALVSGKPYRVQSVDPWSTGNIVRVAFYHPATITGTWLTVGRAPYRATYRNVKSIKVFVDIAPLAGRRHRSLSTISWVDGHFTLPYRDGTPPGAAART